MTPTAGGPAPAAVPARLLTPISPPAGADCPAIVLTTLGRVLQRIYNEGVSSEEVLAARDLINKNQPLHQAVEGGDSAGAQKAAAGLLATKHMTDLTVERGGRVLASAGEPAIAPLQGRITGSGGATIGSYLTSLFSDHTFESEAKGITYGEVAVRAKGKVQSGSATFGRAGTARRRRADPRRRPLRVPRLPGRGLPVRNGHRGGLPHAPVADPAVRCAAAKKRSPGRCGGWRR